MTVTLPQRHLVLLNLALSFSFIPMSWSAPAPIPSLELPPDLSPDQETHVHTFSLKDLAHQTRPAETSSEAASQGDTSHQSALQLRQKFSDFWIGYFSNTWVLVTRERDVLSIRKSRDRLGKAWSPPTLLSMPPCRPPLTLDQSVKAQALSGIIDQKSVQFRHRQGQEGRAEVMMYPPAGSTNQPIRVWQAPPDHSPYSSPPSAEVLYPLALLAQRANPMLLAYWRHQGYAYGWSILSAQDAAGRQWSQPQLYERSTVGMTRLMPTTCLTALGDWWVGGFKRTSNVGAEREYLRIFSIKDLPNTSRLDLHHPASHSPGDGTTFKWRRTVQTSQGHHPTPRVFEVTLHHTPQDQASGGELMVRVHGSGALFQESVQISATPRRIMWSSLDLAPHQPDRSMWLTLAIEGERFGEAQLTVARIRIYR